MKGGLHLCNLLLYEIHYCFEILSQLLSPVGQSLSFVQPKEDDQDVDKGLSFEDVTSGAMQWGTSSTFGHLNQSCGPRAHRSQQQRQQGQRTGGHRVHLSKISCGSDSKYIKYIYMLQQKMFPNTHCPHHQHYPY